MFVIPLLLGYIYSFSTLNCLAY